MPCPNRGKGQGKQGERRQVSRKGRPSALMRAGALISAGERPCMWERPAETHFYSSEAGFLGK